MVLYLSRDYCSVGYMVPVFGFIWSRRYTSGALLLCSGFWQHNSEVSVHENFPVEERSQFSVSRFVYGLRTCRGRQFRGMAGMVMTMTVCSCRCLQE